MIIETDQAKLLQSLTSVIEKEWGISIGYSCPMGSFVSSDNTYVLLDKAKEGTVPEDYDWESHFFLLKKDSQIDGAGDENCQKFLERVNEALLSGELYQEAGIIREVDGAVIEVTKKVDGRFHYEIKRDRGSVGACSAIEDIRKRVPRFSSEEKKKEFSDFILEKFGEETLRESEQEDKDMQNLLCLIYEIWPEEKI